MATCPCDNINISDCLTISPGLSHLERQYLSFGDFRNNMVEAIADKPALHGWSAEAEQDMGVMLIEMWAYVLDVTQFYDSAIANECYLLTCKRDVSASRIVSLLGYKLKPALSAQIDLAVEADGYDTVTLPPGTGFRSEGFDDEPPQIFELITEHMIQPEYNGWDLVPIPKTTFPGRLLLSPKDSGLPKSGVIVISEGSTPLLAGQILGTTPYDAPDGQRYQEIDIDASTSSLNGKSVETLSLRLMGLMAGKSPHADLTSFGGITLDGLYPQIRNGDPAVLEIDGQFHKFKLFGVRKTDVTIFETLDPTVADITAPATQIPISWLFLLAIGHSTNQDYTLHFNPIRVGTLVAPGKTEISLSDITAQTALKPPEHDKGAFASPADFLIKGQRELGAEISGTVIKDATTQDYRFAKGSGNPALPEDLLAPVRLYGNVVRAVRGESVSGEVLGSTDASQPNNRFKLKNKPLSWLSDDRPLLDVFVNGVRWHRVNSLYTAGPDDQIYILDIDEEGYSWVLFGDGNRGQRPNSGIQNVIANYSFGAGAAKPPPGGITQIAKAVKGLKKVQSMTVAEGGRDPENAEDLKTHAPASALTLGRAVSVQDFEALARGYPGILNVSAGWAWDPRRQRAVVSLRVIGDGGVDTNNLQNWLASMAAPDMPISVSPATAVPASLDVSVEFHPDHIREVTEAEIMSTLTDPETGLLSLRHIPISGVLYRSQISKAVQQFAGVNAVTSLRFKGADMAWAVDIQAGHYYDFSGAVGVT